MQRVTEEEAINEKKCPYRFGEHTQMPLPPCLGSTCMAWQWHYEWPSLPAGSLVSALMPSMLDATSYEKTIRTVYGYCGRVSR